MSSWLLFLPILLFAPRRQPLAASYCSIVFVDSTGKPTLDHAYPKPSAVVAQARVIIVASPYRSETRPPADSAMGGPETILTFRVREVLKGSLRDTTLELPGRFVDHDDVNPGFVPDRAAHARPIGACWSFDYVRGASYLLMLYPGPDSALTTHWAWGSPVDEELRGSDDPWLSWVREQIRTGTP